MFVIVALRGDGMTIQVLQLTAEVRIHKVHIKPSVDDIRTILKGPVDTVKLFTGVQSFIRRQPNELEENKLVHGVYGDVVFTGGHGSYIAGLSL